MKVQVKANELLAMQEFVSTDISRPGMTGVNVELNGVVKLRATDGHVAARMTVSGEFKGDGSFTVKFSKDHVKMLKAVKLAPVELTVDGDAMVISTSFELRTFPDPDDVDVLYFSGDAHQFFAAEYLGAQSALMALFYRDTQGTADESDDFFEMVARYEWADSLAYGSYEIFEAFELPETGDYFLAVTVHTETGNYNLSVSLYSSDGMLVADQGGSLPHGEEIAYVSNTIGENNNALGANEPRQLVYLDFDGGTATKYYDDYGFDVPVPAFDLNAIDPRLVGYEDTVINGDGNVVGIVDNVISIYRNTPASHPAGQLTVERITTLAEWNAAVEGLYFTTVDPAAWGLDPETDFTTVFIGDADDTVFGVHEKLVPPIGTPVEVIITALPEEQPAGKNTTDSS